MAPVRRRVSYVVPSPPGPVPQLQLPPHGLSRNGAIGPLLVPQNSHLEYRNEVTPKWAQHPRHRLGVVSLALDTSTLLVGRNAPEGILYTGGRDGLAISWDLAIPMKRRTHRYGFSHNAYRTSLGRWELMTGWADDVIEEDLEEEDLRSDGDILGDVKQSGARRKRSSAAAAQIIPLEHAWETDVDALQPGKMSQFRQCAQVHADWVNDILLCNRNQTLVSASSDGTVKAWNPHVPDTPEPVTIGQHADYVRCLTLCREQSWVASGSFDRTIKLWDVARAPSISKPEPLMTLLSPEAAGPKASVYALTADAYGSIVASGSPERVVRMWDPRSGKRIGKLVGHTDNIRAICISEDSRYLLTGSADASIKLWSMSSQRCLHTFTHHTDSVWSLYSNHPSLEIFYSGDRSGIVCKVDVEDCADVSEGECVVLCQDTNDHNVSEGINKIVVLDDSLLWTASGSSNVKRWKVPPRRAIRAAALGFGVDADSSLPSESPQDYSPSRSVQRNSFEIGGSRTPVSSYDNALLRRESDRRTSFAPSLDSSLATDNYTLSPDREGSEMWYGIPFESLVKLTSPNETIASFGPTRGRDPEIATLYSAASVMSMPRISHTPLPPTMPNAQLQRSTSPMPSETIHSRAAEETTLHPVKTARADFEEREIAADAVPLNTVPDDVIVGDHGLVRAVVLNDRVHVLTVDTAGEVAVWDIVRGLCLGRFSSDDVAAASFSGSTASGSIDEQERSPREALETVKERIEGEAVVLAWSSVDTKTGILTVHLNEKCFEAEIYADEAGYGPEKHFNDDMRLNIGKWVLRNLFQNFIRAEQRLVSRRVRDHTTSHATQGSQHRNSSPMHGGNGREPPRYSLSEESNHGVLHTSTTVITSANMLPAASPSIPPTARSSPLIAPMIPLASRDATLSAIPQSPESGNDATPMPRAPRRSVTIDQGSHPPIAGQNDYFSLRRRASISTGGNGDDFSGWGGPGKKDTPASPTSPTPSTPSGLMGRLKAFGKSSKRHAGELSAPGEVPATVAETHSDEPGQPIEKTPLQVLLSNPLTPPNSAEAPTLSLPSDTTIMISEEALSGWTVLYRGQLTNIGVDVKTLEEAMPMWLLEYLLMNKAPTVTISKLGFVLLPYPNKEPGGEQLPELLNTTQSKLTASRFLRVRKLTYHVQDKLDKIAGVRSTTNHTPRSSSDAQSVSLTDKGRDGKSSPRPRPDELYEILCNDMVLPLDMTLAAVRQYVWRQSGELTMHYRRRRSTTPH